MFDFTCDGCLFVRTVFVGAAEQRETKAEAQNKLSSEARRTAAVGKGVCMAGSGRKDILTKPRFMHRRPILNTNRAGIYLHGKLDLRWTCFACFC